MIDLLEYIARGITENNQVSVGESTSEGIHVYTIHAPKEVMGILIGKEGRTIRAIRLLARARAIKEQVSIRVELEEAVT